VADLIVHATHARRRSPPPARPAPSHVWRLSPRACWRCRSAQTQAPPPSPSGGEEDEADARRRENAARMLTILFNLPPVAPVSGAQAKRASPRALACRHARSVSSCPRTSHGAMPLWPPRATPRSWGLHVRAHSRSPRLPSAANRPQLRPPAQARRRATARAPHQTHPPSSRALRPRPVPRRAAESEAWALAMAARTPNGTSTRHVICES
jgi:hypothetical protein